MREPRIVGIGLIPLNLPMHQPFITALGQKRVSRNLLVAARLSNGIIGYGEASASLAWPQETQAAMTKTLGPITRQLMGEPIGAFRRLSACVWEMAGEHPTAASALECALLDAFAKAKGIPLWSWLGGKRRSVTTALTISAWEPAFAARVARRASLAGFQRLKVKVTGHDGEEDIRRLIAVHKAAPRATLWVDANQGLSGKEAVHLALFLRQSRLPVELLEQPVARGDWDGLSQVWREGKIPVVADESARTVEEAAALIRKKLVPALNVKLAKSGLFGALKIIRMAKAARVRLMIGCMAESVIGLSASVHLACGTGAFDFVDLDSHLLVASPACQAGFISRGARLSIAADTLGSGVSFPTP